MPKNLCCARCVECAKICIVKNTDLFMEAQGLKHKHIPHLLLITMLCVSISLTSCGKKQSQVYEHTNKAPFVETVDQKTQSYRDIYKKARFLQTQKKYDEAYQAFKSIDNKYLLLGDFILYHKAEIAKEMPNEQAVLDNLRLLLKKYPKSDLIDDALYAIGQSFVRLRDSESAETYFTELLDQYPHSMYATGACYYLGEIYASHKKTQKKAIDLYKRYIKKAPDGKFASYSADGILNLTKDNDLSSEDFQYIAMAYYHSGQHKKALDNFGTKLNQENWYAIGKSQHLVNGFEKALGVYTIALNTLENLDKNQVDEVVKSVARAKGNNYQAWKQCEALFPKYADIALYFQAKKLYFQDALGIYKKLVSQFPNSTYAPESHWFIIWDAFSKKDYKKVKALAKKHIKNYPTSRSASRVAFWAGKTHERLGETLIAQKIYENIVNTFHGDYYAYRSHHRLNSLKNGISDPLWKTNSNGYHYNYSPINHYPGDFQQIAQKYNHRIAELLYLGDVNSVRLFLEDKKDPLIESYQHLKAKNFPKSIIAIRDAKYDVLNFPPNNKKEWKFLYPIHYGDLVYQHASKNGIDPLLAQALMKEESYFNHKAVSFSNAYGLMQLLPSTAKNVAHWEKMENFTQTDLFDPEINIQLGTRYLKYTHDFFENNSMLAVAAYNGGAGSVSEWIKSLDHRDWDEFVENIPYDETRNYIRKVFSSYWNYKEIYAQ